MTRPQRRRRCAAQPKRRYDGVHAAQRKLAAVGLAAAALSGCGGAGASRQVELVAHWSRWSAEAVTVPAGVPVRFVVRNDDPIAHELIVGDRAVQDAHERGTETHHGARPTEIDLPPGSARTTTVTFERPGRVYFACHLPGHYAYGMRGVLDVR